MSVPSARTGIPILDFHAHFPVRGGSDRAQAEYVSRFGEGKRAVIRRHLAADQEAWRRAWGFPAPEPPGDATEMAARWAQERKRHQLVRVVFETGRGNQRLARVLRPYP